MEYLALEYWRGDTFLPIEQTGEPCRTDEPLPCLTALDVPSEPGRLIPQLRATRDNQVLVMHSREELVRFLAPIDSAAEARLLLATEGYHAGCDGRSGSRAAEGGFELQLFRSIGCDGRSRHLLHVDAGGNVTLLDSRTEKEADPNCVIGRRPHSLVRGPRRWLSTLASHFAQSAELEAASVPAFEKMCAELQAHGAPRTLQSRALLAAEDETRHARAVARLARAFGGRPRRPRVLPTQVRSLEAVALDNAVEGCIRETYGALVAHHQARAASEAKVRSLYQQIARDETKHAQLSWDLAAWVGPRLSRSARRRIAEASRTAVGSLQAAVRAPVAPELVRVAGLPGPHVGAALVDRLARAWTVSPLLGQVRMGAPRGTANPIPAQSQA